MKELTEAQRAMMDDFLQGLLEEATAFGMAQMIVGARSSDIKGAIIGACGIMFCDSIRAFHGSREEKQKLFDQMVEALKARFNSGIDKEFQNVAGQSNIINTSGGTFDRDPENKHN